MLLCMPQATATLKITVQISYIKSSNIKNMVRHYHNNTKYDELVNLHEFVNTIMALSSTIVIK